jgi:hypothetical protein
MRFCASANITEQANAASRKIFFIISSFYKVIFKANITILTLFAKHQGHKIGRPEEKERPKISILMQIKRKEA